jgi:hypothetical protein
LCALSWRTGSISDVALLKRPRNSEEWLRFLGIELLRENVAYRLEEGIGRTIRIVLQLAKRDAL